MKNILFSGLTFLILWPNQLKSQSDTLSYIMVPDSMPSFIYGPENFGRFIFSVIDYPVEARINQLVQGKVFISFIVDTMGKVIDPIILKDIGAGCGEEAKRAIKLTSGLWAPGIYKGKIVNVKMTMPIKFTCLNCAVFKSKYDYTEIKPSPDFYYNQGITELNANRTLTAIFYFSQALEKNPKDINSLFNRALAKLKNNNKIGACEDLHKSQSLGDKESTVLINKNCK